MPKYGDPKYWDDRYTKFAGQTFDWLESYTSLKGLLKTYLKPEMRILILGCGNAVFSEDLYDDGFKRQLNVDISPVVIKQMQARNVEARPEIHWEVMDVCDMREDLEDNQFDMVIDKSTIDAILCGEDSFLNVARMVKETQRVLKPGGYYFVVSYGKPESRSFHFEQDFLSFYVREFVAYEPAQEGEEEQQDEKTHYIYLCQKRADADEICAKNWPKCLEQLLIDAEMQKELNKDYDDESDPEGSDENEQQDKEEVEIIKKPSAVDEALQTPSEKGGDKAELQLETPSFAKVEEDPKDLKSDDKNNQSSLPKVEAPLKEQDDNPVDTATDTVTDIVAADTAAGPLRLKDSKSLELK